jgi:ABC-type antimicrobial peptide transport system ATPase subunit
VRTAAFVAAATSGLSWKTSDAVDREKPAWRATSARVTRRGVRVVSKAVSPLRGRALLDEPARLDRSYDGTQAELVVLERLREVGSLPDRSAHHRECGQELAGGHTQRGREP